MIYLLPRWIDVYENSKPGLTFRDYCHAVLIVGVFTLTAGLSGLIPTHPGRGAVIGLGFGVQSAIRGLIETGKDLVRPLVTKPVNGTTTP